MQKCIVVCVLCNICAALSDYKKRKKEKVTVEKKHRSEEKAAPDKKIERKEEEKKKSKIQKCLHPLYPFAELYGCLLELGPGQV